VPGVDFQAQAVRLPGTHDQSFQLRFAFPIPFELLGKRARVQLDKLAARPRRRLDLRRVRRNDKLTSMPRHSFVCASR